MSKPTIEQLLDVSPCEYSEGLSIEQFIDPVIHQMWSQIPRIAGPAFTVKCGKGDHLSLHAAIYRAKAGDVIVAQKGSVFIQTNYGSEYTITKPVLPDPFLSQKMMENFEEIIGKDKVKAGMN